MPCRVSAAASDLTRAAARSTARRPANLAAGPHVTSGPLAAVRAPEGGSFVFPARLFAARSRPRASHSRARSGRRARPCPRRGFLLSRASDAAPRGSARARRAGRTQGDDERLVRRARGGRRRRQGEPQAQEPRRDEHEVARAHPEVRRAGGVRGEEVHQALTHGHEVPAAVRAQGLLRRPQGRVSARVSRPNETRRASRARAHDAADRARERMMTLVSSPPRGTDDASETRADRRRHRRRRVATVSSLRIR